MRKARIIGSALTCLSLAMLLGFSAVSVGCEEEGSMEKMGEKADEAMDEAKDKVEEVGDEIEDALDG